jgi:hypothetical protein
MDLKNDILRGAKAIAEFTGESERSTYYQLERGMLPGFKRGGLWTARKSTILAQIERLEARAAEREVA